jgi:hypothetical protein
MYVSACSSVLLWGLRRVYVSPWFSVYGVVAHSSSNLPDVLYNITGGDVLPLRDAEFEVHVALHPEYVTELSLLNVTFM